jgi:hypothetical protein
MNVLFTMSNNRQRRIGQATPGGNAKADHTTRKNLATDSPKGKHNPNRKPHKEPAQQPPPNPNGGARRDRTDDLMLAKHALSQLSYGPGNDTPAHPAPARQMVGLADGGPGKTWTSDLTLIKRAL